MSWNDTILLDLQNDVKARLDNNAFFTDINVVLERKGVTLNDLDIEGGPLAESKAGKTGVCAIVLMPQIEEPEQNAPGPVVRIVQQVQIIADRENNQDADVGTGKEPEQVALNVLNLLHQYINYDLGWVLYPDKRAVVPVPTGRAKWVSYTVTMKFNTGLSRVARVVDPTMTPSGGNIVLATTTAGATIYYSLDKSYPGPANAASHLYTAPFAAPAPGTTLRVVGYLANYIDSNVIAADIT